MKKYILLKIIILLGFVTILTACGALDVNKPNKTDEAGNAVTTHPEKVSGTDVEIKYINATDKEFTFSQAFELEKLVSDTWAKITRLPDTFFSEIGIILGAGKSKNETYVLANYFENLSAGHYRISTEMLGQGEKITVFTEFDLE
jgi:uncharacterized protein (DUF608 family)